MRRFFAILLLALAAMQSGCARPTPQPAPDPDAALLAGRWEQLIPVGSLPQSLELDASGSALVNGSGARWRSADGTLYVRQGGGEEAYAYTVSGYMLTLTGGSEEASDFYVNPGAFASGADGNALFKGQWAAFSTFAKMSFDGAGGMDNIVHTTAGRTALPLKYAARDGILQTADAGGNYTYNLFEFGPDGALLLAETSEYDKDDKQWTPWWKQADPAPGFIGSWALAFDTQPGSVGLPSSLKLEAGGIGAAMQGAGPSGIRWEYYAGGFVILEYSETNLQYAWCENDGGALYLGNPDVDEAWYIDASRYNPSASNLKGVAGTWKAEDGKMALVIGAGGSVTAVNDAGAATVLPAAAADGVMRLRQGGRSYYAAYGVDGDTMRLYYGSVPFFDPKEMPVVLMKQP